MSSRNRRTSILILGSIFLLSSLSAGAQTWKTGSAGPLLKIAAANPCTVTWYDPEMFATASGLGLLAQGGNGQQTCSPQGLAGLDAFFPAQWSASTQAWTTPAATACPAVRGFYMQGGLPQHCGYSQTHPGPVASPSVVKVGSRYFMAFSGGNADYIQGKIFWAVSNDGSNWNVFNTSPPAGLTWKPIITTEHGEPCHPFGVGQLSLSYDASEGPNGTFYLHFLYAHDTPNQELEVLAYRFPYNPADTAFGLPDGFTGGASAPGQICIGTGTATTCSWVNHSGRLVWDYENKRIVPGDPALSRYHGMQQMGYGGGDIKYDPKHGKWLHVYMTITNSVHFQTTTSLASSVWSSPLSVNLSSLDTAMTSLYPSTYQSGERYYGGLWYGALSGRTGMWLFQPVDFANCSNVFAGLGIVPAELCSSETPTITAVSPANGPSAGGGSVVTVTGTNLDCASAVTFGATGGTITAKSPNTITVTSPAHAPGVVSVTVNTPSGSATQTNAFTYSLYEGYHESLSCNGTVGWAWDQGRPNDSIDVDLYDGATLLGTVAANGYRADLQNAGKGNGYHGFGFTLPASLRDGNAHSIAAKLGGTSTLLTWSPLIVTCAPPTAHVVWMQPQALAGFGTPGSLVMGGNASGAAPGTTVSMSWRDVTANGSWTNEPYHPLPDASNNWYLEILNANYSHQYAVYVAYGTATSATCTYQGNGAVTWCP